MNNAQPNLFDYRYTRGVVRRPGPELKNAVSKDGGAQHISIDRAQIQHDRYVRALSDLGIELIGLPGDPSFPDGCFVEDTCVMLPGTVVITVPGAPSRRDETRSVMEALSPIIKVVQLKEGGTLDGGDILRLGRTYLIGLSGRTNAAGARELADIVSAHGAKAVFVEVTDGLHLKSAVTPLSPTTVLGQAQILSHGAFDGAAKIVVPDEEAGAANAVAANGVVIMADGYPETKKRVEAAGFSVVVCDASEFAKADGSLTCLSILW